MEIMVEHLRSSFSGQRVLLTGHTGFKGSWLLMMLQELGANVRGIALAPEEQSLFNQISGEDFCDSYILDIRNASAFKEAILSFQPQYILHLAAQPLVLEAYRNPIDNYATNIMGLVHLYEAAKDLEEPCVILNVTTDKVYRNLEQGQAFAENDELGGGDPYSNSKACAELISRSYRDTIFPLKRIDEHGISIATARSGNVIGGGDWAENRLIPDLARSIYSSQDLEIRNPHAVRPWQFVLDPIWGYLMLAAAAKKDPQAFSEAWNFGPEKNSGISVGDLIEKSIANWGEGSASINQQADQPKESGFLMLDNTKAKDSLGWRPAYDIDETVERTISWYASFDGNNATELCQNQIQEFLKSWIQVAKTSQ